MHLLALCSFAIAQPLFDLIGRDPTFLVHHRSSPVGLLALVVLLMVAPPLVLLALELLVGAVHSASGLRLHLLLVGLLCFLLAFPPLRRLFGGRELGALALGLAIAAGAAAAYHLSAKVRVLGRVAALGALVFPALFLLQDDIRELLGPERAPGVDASGGATIRLDAPLVILLFDELPLLSLLDASFDIDRASFPNFARLRDRSTWFRNFTTNHEETVGAVPALLTGRLVRGLQAPTREYYPESLLTLIAKDQLRAVHEHTTRLAPELEVSGERKRGLEPILRDLVAVYGHLVLPRAMTGALPEVSRTWGDFWQAPAATELGEAQAGVPDERARGLLDFTDRLARNPEPGLFYLHVMLPHHPLRCLPSGKLYESPRPRDPAATPRQSAAERALELYQRHLLQLQYVDRLIGIVIDRLEESDAWDRVLLVVLSDHGTSFAPSSPGRELALAEFPEDTLRVPFFLKLPGQREGAVVDRNVESIDVLPTLVEAGGFVLPFAVDGISALGEQPARPFKVAYNKRGLEHRSPAELDPATPALTRRLELFPPSTDPLRFYRLPPWGALVGTALTDQATLREADPTRTVEIDQLAELDNVDLTGPTLPVHLTGRLNAKETTWLALALDGTIAATARTRPTDQAAELSALMPEAFLSQGRNHLRAFRIEGPSHQPTLLELTVE